jgi:hypothetical protein
LKVTTKIHRELAAIYESWVPYEEASHVIVAFYPDGSGGGVMATARCELDAWRYARTFKKHGFKNVSVRPENDETHAQVSQELTSWI